VKTTLTTALESALDFLEGLDRNPVAPTADRATLLSRLQSDAPEEGLAPELVIRELVHTVDGGIVGSASGRFFGWVIGGALPAAIGADWLTSVWDNNATLYACGPAASVIEEVCGRWLKQILGLPGHASFAFTTGCQMAHVTCLAAARHAVLAKRGWDVEKQGLAGSPPIRVVCGDVRHGALDRAIRLLGLGSANVVPLADFRQLESALDGSPAIVLLQAGEINSGAFDAFEKLIPIAKARGAWVHVDGAFGLWAAASPRYRHLVRGVQTADSWATDGHKWLNTPFDCGYAFVIDPESHRAAMSHRASYLTHSTEARDQLEWTPEWSRRGRGFPTYAALRQLGRKGVAEQIENCCRHARELVHGIARMPGVELVSEPILNQGLVRFTAMDTDAVIEAINQSGEAFFTGTTWRGTRAMRVSVCNWRTSDDDVRRTLHAVERILACRATSAS